MDTSRKPYSAFLAETRRIIDSNFVDHHARAAGDDGGLLFVSARRCQRPLSMITPIRTVITPLTHDQPALGQSCSLDECVPYRTLERTGSTSTACAIDIYHMIGVDLRNANGLRFSVRFCRPKAADNFGPQEREFLEMLASHISVPLLMACSSSSSTRSASSTVRPSQNSRLAWSRWMSGAK